jgi:hypothetical protein
MIDNQTIVALVIIVLLVYALFFSPLRVPSWLRTVFLIVLAVLAFVWLLNLIGVVAF